MNLPIWVFPLQTVCAFVLQGGCPKLHISFLSPFSIKVIFFISKMGRVA